MKIALLGAPGSGKTEIGKRLVRNLNREKDGKWKLIDGYVDKLAQRTGREYGMAGDIPHNVQVMAERWTLEAEALHAGYQTVTCGSIYETMLYTAFTRLVPPETEDEILRWSHEARTAMQFLNLMEQATFNYDILFYVPLVSASSSMTDNDWAQVIDAKLHEILEGCFRYAVPLKDETTRQKVTHALTVIRDVRARYEALSAEADDEPAVR